MRYNMKTLEQLKKEYVNIVGQIMELGQADVLIELNKSIKKVEESTPSINESVFKAFNEPRKVGEDKFYKAINNMEDNLTSKIRNINNNMNVSLDELKDSVDIDISDFDDRLNSIDKKLEELEKYLDNINSEQVEINNNLEHLQNNPPLENVVNNINIEQVDINKRLKHTENYLTDNYKFVSLEGLNELKKINAEFDNLNNKSNNIGCK